jgi:hypothetical protein
VYSLALIIAQKLLRFVCGQLSTSVISTAGLNKFNIIPKLFIPSITNILFLKKSTKCKTLIQNTPVFVDPLLYF